jgi:hypothetical protein
MNVWATSITANGLSDCLVSCPNLSTLVYHNADMMEHPTLKHTLSAAAGAVDASNHRRFCVACQKDVESGSLSLSGHGIPDQQCIDCQILAAFGQQQQTTGISEKRFSVRHLVLSRLPETFKMGQFVATFPELESVFVRGAATNLQVRAVGIMQMSIVIC